jgi:hypothetical protein
LIILVAPTHWRQEMGFEACNAAIARWLCTLACQGLMGKLGSEHEVDGSSFPGLHADADRVFW